MLSWPAVLWCTSSAAVDPATVAVLQHQKDLLPRLRVAVASETGIDMPELAEEKRISWANLLFAAGSLIALRVRFFQRQGYDAAAAVSSGAIASTASWTAKALLPLVAVGFSAGTFHAPSDSGGHEGAVWIVLAVILAAGIALALIGLVPRLRRMASSKVRPHLLNIWGNIKTIATAPRKIVYILAGSILSQVFVILALGASLHAVGEHASIATLITVNTLAAIVGGAVPIPGGAGVVEAGLIAGLTSAGIPQQQAVAAVFIERLFTSYLPPIWGWFTLAWMRRREYV
jgi:glycosyltransferase 2 family protein